MSRRIFPTRRQRNHATGKPNISQVCRTTARYLDSRCQKVKDVTTHPGLGSRRRDASRSFIDRQFDESNQRHNVHHV